MKKLIVLMTILISVAFVPSNAKAQDPATVAEISAEVYTAVKWAYNNQEKLKAIFRGFHYNHRWWACVYQDGFATYNNFRSYRTSLDAYNYFVLGNGDCDAVYGNNNSHICYQNPSQARYYTQQHGPIVDIQFQDDNGNYKSIYAY